MLNWLKGIGRQVLRAFGLGPKALPLDTVLGWCYANGVDKDSAEAAVAQQIENQKNPPIVSPPLPWAVSPSIDKDV